MAMYLLAQSYQKIKNNAYLLVEGLHKFQHLVHGWHACPVASCSRCSAERKQEYQHRHHGAGWTFSNRPWSQLRDETPRSKCGDQNRNARLASALIAFRLALCLWFLMGRRRVTLSQAKLVLPAKIEKKENEILCRQNFSRKLQFQIF